jgi:dihydroorotase
VCLDVLVRKNKFKLPYVIDLMTRRAANILKLPAGTLAPGAAADVCIFDPNETWTYDAKQGFSKSQNSPWSGQKLTGKVKTTVVDGRIVYDQGRIV